jgi:DNA-binding CsgD family transcriptional regulator
MRQSRFCFALIDPVTHLVVDANEHYAALFDLDVEEIKGRSVMSLFPEDISSSIQEINGSFARGTQQLIRGQITLQRPSGATIQMAGWSRRFEGMSERPLIVTCAVEVGTEVLPDDRHWVAQSPDVFGLPEGLSASEQSVEQRAEELEHLLWRIGQELRSAGLMPVPGESAQSSPIKQLGGLTARQREVVARLVAGDRVSTIAREMFLSPSTIRNHLTAVYRKFGVHSQVELISVLRDLSGKRTDV